VLNVDSLTTAEPPRASAFDDKKKYKQALEEFSLSLADKHRVGYVDPDDRELGHCPVELTRLPFPEELERPRLAVVEASGGEADEDDIWAKMPPKLMKRTAKHLLG
ncbi:unnamed protein product, partial [Prorocentrum cordatum]